MGLLLHLATGGSTITYGSIHNYTDEAFKEQSNARYFNGGSEGLYASHDLNSSSSSSSSFIRFDNVTFVRTSESALKHSGTNYSTSGLVEAIILRGTDRDRIGGAFLNSDAVCCTAELASNGSCSFGQVIIRRDSDEPDWPKQVNTFFLGNQTEARMSPEVVIINKTGMYYLYFMICDPDLNGTIVRGRTVWKNPFGYLPAKVAPLRRFFGWMTFGYLLLGLVWSVRVFRFRKPVTELQYLIGFVIALGTCEMTVRFFEFTRFNRTGLMPRDITMWAVVTFTTVKKTLSRILLLDVARGYGVLKHTFGGVTSRLLLLGVTYFVASESLEIVERLGHANEFTGETLLFFVIPVLLLDSWILWIIFSSATRTFHQRQIQRSVEMIEFYGRFTNMLGVFALFCIPCIIYEISFYMSDIMADIQPSWIIPASWAVLSYGLLVFICITWPLDQLGEAESGIEMI